MTDQASPFVSRLRQERQHQEHLRELAQRIADLDKKLASGEYAYEDDDWQDKVDQICDLATQLADAVLHGPY